LEAPPPRDPAWDPANFRETFVGSVTTAQQEAQKKAA
jgi:hypothetical protein